MATLEDAAKGAMTVAIVDDDERLVSALLRDLGSRGLKVHSAPSAKQALELLERYDVDVMLTDLRMSGRDGIDLIRAVGVLSPNTRSILMSAFATARDYKVAMELGAVEVLGKPFTPDELHKALDKAIGRDGAVQGEMQGVSLKDVLTLFHAGGRSVTIRLGGTASAIHMHEGEIVHAEHGRLVAREALRSLFRAPLGRVRTGPLDSSERSIEQPFRRLLEEMLGEGAARAEKSSFEREVLAGADRTAAAKQEVNDMIGRTGERSDPGPPPERGGHRLLLIGGIMGVALGVLLIALGLRRGAEVAPSGASSASQQVRRIDIDVSAWIRAAGGDGQERREADRAAQNEALRRDRRADPAGAHETAAEPANVVRETPRGVAQARAPRGRASGDRRAARRVRGSQARRTSPNPRAEIEVSASAASTPEEPEVASRAPAGPRKPSIGTIAAQEPAIGAVQSAKPVIGTVSR